MLRRRVSGEYNLNCKNGFYGTYSDNHLFINSDQFKYKNWIVKKTDIKEIIEIPENVQAKIVVYDIIKYNNNLTNRFLKSINSEFEITTTIGYEVILYIPKGGKFITCRKKEVINECNVC